MPRGGKREGAGRKKGEADRPRRNLQNLIKPEADKAIKVLLESLMDDNARIRLDAAKEILDRGFGKSPLAITGTDGGDIQVTINKIVHSADD